MVLKISFVIGIVSDKIVNFCIISLSLSPLNTKPDFSNVFTLYNKLKFTKKISNKVRHERFKFLFVYMHFLACTFDLSGVRSTTVGCPCCLVGIFALTSFVFFPLTLPLFTLAAFAGLSFP